jgi:hypothetical protein
MLYGYESLFWCSWCLSDDRVTYPGDGFRGPGGTSLGFVVPLRESFDAGPAEVPGCATEFGGRMVSSGIVPVPPPLVKAAILS